MERVVLVELDVEFIPKAIDGKDLVLAGNVTWEVNRRRVKDNLLADADSLWIQSMSAWDDSAKWRLITYVSFIELFRVRRLPPIGLLWGSHGDVCSL